MIEIAVRDPPPLAAVSSGLPKPVLELVKATMAHDRDNRIPSAAALADRIETTLATLGASATYPLPDPASLMGTGAPSAPRSTTAQTSSALATNAGLRARRGSWRVGAAALFVVLLLGGAGLWWKLGRGKRVVAAAPPSDVPSAAAAPSSAAPPAVASAAPTGSAKATAASEAPGALPTSTSTTDAGRVPPRKGKPVPPKKEGGKDPPVAPVAPVKDPTFGI
jgi:hypothetical protein